jgi:hypothetical protein
MPDFENEMGKSDTRFSNSGVTAHQGRRDVMTRIALLLSLAFSMLTIIQAVGADKFECPSPFKPNTAAKLEQIKGLLPSTSAMKPTQCHYRSSAARRHVKATDN